MLDDQVVAQRQRSLKAMSALQQARDAMTRCAYELEWFEEAGERHLVRTSGDRRTIIKAGSGHDLETMRAKHVGKRKLAQLGFEQAHRLGAMNSRRQ